MFGYTGRLLRVDLTGGKVAEEPLDVEAARAYIGGSGYATWTIYREVAARVAPLSPENRLVFMTGPLTGTPYPTTARYQVCTRSPLTGLWVDASSSGVWGEDLKRAGYDGVIVQGKSPHPVFLSIDDSGAELRDAAGLWGLDTVGCVRRVRQELSDDKARVACIGPAGERQVLITSVINDEGRAAGRGGVGAVMGAKNLKAIAVRGSGQVPVADPEKLETRIKEITCELTGWRFAGLSKWGTAANMDTGWVTGLVPVQNWRKGLWKEGCLNLGGKKMAETLTESGSACVNCPVRCSRWVKVDKPGLKLEGPGPEYQTLAAFGAMLLNDDLDTVCAANDLCNRYGLDTISTGAAVAFAMEAYERGIITRGNAGFEVTWGSSEAILGLVRQIGEKRGLGEVLGLGVKRAAEHLGKGSADFAIHVKGLEVPMHDPRAFFSIAANYATGPRGADHMRGNVVAYEAAHQGSRFEDAGKALIARESQDTAAVINSLILCMFGGREMSTAKMAELLTAVTGEGFSEEEVQRAGERIVNLQRLFNLRCGATGADDRLPSRLLRPTSEGGHAGKAPDIELQLREYYEARGWSADGRPSLEKLRELGLPLNDE
ncbi:MAG: aldehyde ferredoxin oxidoreductase family protein [Chloroflexi bacterium]|nr:aldehyde ferredoxin oxidoreductase family protein [Chloroflexota bacterium]